MPCECGTGFDGCKFCSQVSLLIFLTILSYSTCSLGLLINRSIPVAMSFGFCFALVPLLSLDMPTLFPSTGGAAFMRRIPILELSTPEEYLQLIAPPKEEEVEDLEAADASDKDDDDACDCCSPAEKEGKEVEKSKSGVATEETPLLGEP